MNIPTTRIGFTGEYRRIRERGIDSTRGNLSEQLPNDFNKENNGKINYDPQLGWVPHNALGGEPLGVSHRHSSAYLRKQDGLPGSKP